MKDNFLDNFKILDGGMGQELLARGVKPLSNLWSATALMETQYHQIVKDCHKDFINAGAEIILTNTFGCRRRRLEDNQIENRFEELNLADTQSVEAMSHPLDLSQPTRKDLVTEEDLREELQKNAPSVQSGLFLVPKVIEGED